ncbi:MAG: M15 family metallopeptidase [Sarcina sp.]
MDATKSCRDIKQLDKDTMQACEIFLAECKKVGLNIIVTETYRPQARQDYLYEQGRSRPGKVVTNTRKSVHTSKRAFDICHNVKGDEYNNRILDKAGKIGMDLGLAWGGSWTSFVDKPHFELDKGKVVSLPPGVDEEYKKAVQILVDKGIIGSPAAWFPEKNIKLQNVPALIKKVAKYIG